MKVLIRQAESKDYSQIFTLIQEAFENVINSDHQEQHLVARLIMTTAFIPELAIVAIIEDEIVGYILLTNIDITINLKNKKCLALAPIAVTSALQRQRIGTFLMKEAHNRASNLGYDVIILLGHPEYYQRFGYAPINQTEITMPFDVPSEYCMLKTLNNNALEGLSGMVQYPEAFFETKL